jgi:small-conductance mechanosensitive channel
VKKVLAGVADETLKSRSEIVAQDPKPTVYLVKIDKTAMTFELTVYAGEFRHNSIIRDLLNTRIIEEFRKEGIIIA